MSYSSQSLCSGQLPTGASGELVFRSNNTISHNTEGQSKNLLQGNGDNEAPPYRQPLDDIDDTKPDGYSDYGDEDPIEHTRSTHSLLFSEPIWSVPFGFAILIVAVSIATLILVLINNMQGYHSGNFLNVPWGVPTSVRIAQYLALVIGLIMEEEIPAALYMIRQIPKTSLKKTTPQIKYSKFLFSALLRLFMGYLFLINVFLVVVQASYVLDIFYDLMALQFVQQLDDICFELAKKDVLGKRMKRATTRKCFLVQYEKLPFGRRRKLSIFVKVLYLLNLCGYMAGMTIIRAKQDRGDYFCSSISVYFGDEIWDDAIVTNSTGGEERMTLMFAYFNGVYVKNGTRDGRPVYVEQNKYLSEPYKKKIPAQIRYCKSERAWVFMHSNIRKSSINTRNNDDEDECPWLVKSEDTSDFNILEVDQDWKIWTGTVSNGANFQVYCTECEGEVDCNYHGQCVDKHCKCEKSINDIDGYYGYSCQFEKPCLRMRGDQNDTWRVGWVNMSKREPFVLYDRAAYLYEGGYPNLTISENDAVIMTYGGSRWFGAYYEGGGSTSRDEWVSYVTEYHAFWDRVYTDFTKIVSNPNTESSPIGSDFFRIGERGEKYGPFGELYPLGYPPGSGYFDCIERNTTAHLMYVLDQLNS